jgi:hypothetical protein
MCFSCNNMREIMDMKVENNMWKMKGSIFVIFNYQKMYQHIHIR